MAPPLALVTGSLLAAICGCGRLAFTERKDLPDATGADGPVVVDGPIVIDGPRPMITRLAIADGSVRDGLGVLKNGAPDSVDVGTIVQSVTPDLIAQLARAR